MRRVVCREPVLPPANTPGMPKAVPRLSLGGAGAKNPSPEGFAPKSPPKSPTKQPGRASETWVALPQPLQTGGELMPELVPEIARSERDRPGVASSLAAPPASGGYATHRSPPSPPPLGASPPHPPQPSPPDGSPVSARAERLSLTLTQSSIPGHAVELNRSRV